MARVYYTVYPDGRRVARSTARDRSRWPWKEQLVGACLFLLLLAGEVAFGGATDADEFCRGVRREMRPLAWKHPLHRWEW